MTDGWIKIHRRIKEWQHYQEPSVLLVWLDLLTSANTKEGWWHGRKIRRGELFTSIESIHQNTGLDAKTIRTSLAKLEESGEIKKESTNAGTKIIINQFNKYQCSGNNPQPIPQPIPQPTPQPIPQPIPQRVPYKQEYESIRTQEQKNLSTNTHTAREDDFKTFGIFQNVKLTDADLERLRMALAAEGKDEAFLNRCIDKLSTFMAQEGRTYQNHAAAILNWAKTAVMEDDRKTGAAYRPAANPSSSSEADNINRIAWSAMTPQEQAEYKQDHNGLTLFEYEAQKQRTA